MLTTFPFITVWYGRAFFARADFATEDRSIAFSIHITLLTQTQCRITEQSAADADVVIFRTLLMQ